jgi:aldose 1-epimerase
VRIASDPSTSPADYEFRHRVRARFAETDAMGIVHHSRYLPIMEEARVAYLRHIGHPYQSIRDEGIDMTVIEVFLQYRQPIRFDDVIDVHVSLAKVERASFQMTYLLSVDGELRATGATAHGAITMDGRATRLPAWLRELDRAGVPRLLRIGNDRLSAEVAPDNGGRVAQITAGSIDLLIGRGEGPDPGSAFAWGSYPMVPWAGRIRRGRFGFDGDEYELPINFGGHAIHGVGFDTPWTVTRHTAESVELELTLPTDARWPFGGVARQTITIDGATLRMDLSASATSSAMPASLGWHPWFRKPRRLEFHPTAMYRRDDDWITVDELLDVPEPPWDDCFVNTAPLTLDIDGVELRLTSNCSDWVVYDMPAHATCVEPQTAPPDAFTLRPNRLVPGDTLSAWYELTLLR